MISVETDGCLVGIINKLHILEANGRSIYHGIGSGSIGWGWWQGFKTVYHHSSKIGWSNMSTPLVTKSDFSSGDIVGIEVNRNLKKIVFKKNGYYEGEMKGLNIPEELYIAVAIYRSIDFELINFVDYSNDDDDDEKERIEFLVDSKDIYCFEKKNEMFVNLKSLNFELDVLKTLMFNKI